MSNAMRKGKRTLAGVAAGALGLALIPFVATTAQAADAITAAAPDGPLRSGTGFSQTVTVTGTFDDTSNLLAIVPDPSNPGTLTVDDTVTLPVTAGTEAQFTMADASAAGTYTVRVCLVASSATDCSTPIGTPVTYTFTTTGIATQLEISPASRVSVPGVAQSYTVTAKDANNTVTQLASNQSVAVTATQTTGSTTTVTDDTDPLNLGLQSLGQGSFNVANDTAGATSTVTVSPAGALFTNTVTATLVNSTSVAAASAAVASPVSVTVDDTNFLVPSGSASSPVVFTLTRAADDTGAYFNYTVSGGTPAAGIAEVGADGTASVSVTPTATADGDTVALTVAGQTYTVTFQDAAAAITTTALLVAQPGATVTMNGTVSDQFGRPVANAAISGTTTAGPDAGTVTSNALTDAAGAFSITYTGTLAVADDSNTVQITAASGALGSPTSNVVVQYTSTGTVTLTGMTLGTSNVATTAFESTVVVPFAGTADTSVTGLTGSTGNQVPVTANAAIAAPVTYTATGGVLSTTAGAAWNAGSTSVTAAAGTAVYFFSTSVGTATVTATAGDNSLSASIPVVTVQAAAYNMAITPAEQSVAAGGISTVTVSVTDVFGNPVNTSGSDDTGVVTITASGEVLLAGYAQEKTDVRTGADGTATVTIIAGNAAGSGTLAIGPTNFTGYWASDAVLPVGAPAPVTSGAAEVTVSTTPTTGSIVIAGERGTVRGKPGIIVDGLTQGLEGGTIVMPYIKFPGQTSYTAGTARRAVVIFNEAEQLGEFTWARRTGKKTYVYFATEDGSTRSSRIIIPAK